MIKYQINVSRETLEKLKKFFKKFNKFFSKKFDILK